MVREGRYFLIFLPKDILNGLNLNESQPIYAYKHYGYENDVTAFLAGTILVDNYIISLLCCWSKCKPFCS